MSVTNCSSIALSSSVTLASVGRVSYALFESCFHIVEEIREPVTEVSNCCGPLPDEHYVKKVEPSG